LLFGGDVGHAGRAFEGRLVDGQPGIHVDGGPASGRHRQGSDAIDAVVAGVDYHERDGTDTDRLPTKYAATLFPGESKQVLQ
jgi:hypothetical protein